MKWLQRRKSNRRKEPAPPGRWRRLLLLGATAALLLLGGMGVEGYLRQIEWERFRTLEITGELQRVSPVDVRQALEPHLEQGFARIDMPAARAAVVDLPWVADASVRRQWPGALEVNLREEQPVATWRGTALMNANGDVFIDGVSGLSGVLPDVAGPAGSQDVMIYRLLELQDRMAGQGLSLQRLLRTDRRAERFWLTTSHGERLEVRLGRRDNDARLQRFLAVAWPTIRARASQVAYVDLRYTNGFAVGWKTVEGRGEPRREKG